MPVSSPGPETSVPVTIAGRELALAYNLATLSDAMTALGLDTLDELLAKTDKFASAINQAGEGGHVFYAVDPRALSVMLWAGTRRTAGEKALTADEIAESVLLADYPVLLVAVATAMTLCIRGAKRDEPADAPAGEGENPPPAAAAA